MSEYIEIVNAKIHYGGKYAFIMFNVTKNDFSLFCEPYLKTITLLGIRSFIFLALLATLEETNSVMLSSTTGTIISDIDNKIVNS